MLTFAAQAADIVGLEDRQWQQAVADGFSRVVARSAGS
jgi:hypothetical protein